jgi:secretion/DNA translocation related TadE-like protein
MADTAAGCWTAVDRERAPHHRRGADCRADTGCCAEAEGCRTGAHCRTSACCRTGARRRPGACCRPDARRRAVARHRPVPRRRGTAACGWAPGRWWAFVRRSDRGSATVWSIGAIGVLCVVFGVVLALGQAVVSRHRAAGGADLAALAAADHWAQGGTAACAQADRVTGAQGVRLVRCVVVGQVSDVTVASGRGPFAAEVRARAGPAEPIPPTDPPDTGDRASSTDPQKGFEGPGPIGWFRGAAPLSPPSGRRQPGPVGGSGEFLVTGAPSEGSPASATHAASPAFPADPHPSWPTNQIHRPDPPTDLRDWPPAPVRPVPAASPPAPHPSPPRPSPPVLPEAAP